MKKIKACNLIPYITWKIRDKLTDRVVTFLTICTIPARLLIFCIWIILDPCIGLWFRSRERKKQVKPLRVLAKSTPRVLGPRMGRSLTIGREEEATGIIHATGAPRETWKTVGDHPRTDEQTQWHLFKLPFEIRRQIFEQVLGGYTIHIFFLENYLTKHSRCKRDGKLGGCICQASRGETLTACHPDMFKLKGAADRWGQCELVALSKTCRKIYSETIELLYTSNIFDFYSIAEVYKFSLAILPERMRLVKSVQWKYDGSRRVQTYGIGLSPPYIEKATP